ncbi:hypothetical protein [Streptomyces sp. NBC_01236]|uniref:hypothetical protein n=1 Tax=Streptomyces sp. NBC_01236 TaxID=2903789 RepID=UPI002E11E200|nr:hypothetical protein OG324_41515 [Streptomyces sp. NBC_01236]
MGTEEQETTADDDGNHKVDVPSVSNSAERTARPDRTGVLIGVALLAVCSALILYGVFGTGTDDSGQERGTSTTPVTYEVTGTGTADLTYQARSETGKATVVQSARLPWRKTVDVPVGQAPTIGIVLGEHGGTARCILAVRGKYIQSATATGTFGRATCSSARGQ